MTRQQQLAEIISNAALAQSAHERRASETRGVQRWLHRGIARVCAVAIDVTALAMDAPSGANGESDN